MKHLFSLISIALSIGTSESQNGGTELSGNILTRVNVEKYADISLDIRDIKESLANGDSKGALAVYTNGQNAAEGTTAGAKFTLRSLSTSLSSLSTDHRSPPYLFHLYGLGDRDITALDDHKLYADSFVQTSINSKAPVAADAIVALNVWMYAAHVLYQGVHTCDQLTRADNPDELQYKLEGGGVDEFIALWIGQDQRVSSSDGHSLYALTHRAAFMFGQTDPEAVTNFNIKLLYNEGRTALSFPSACTKGDENAVPALWSVANRMLSLMYIPLIQLLLDAVFRSDAQTTRLYATALIPQVSQCRPSIFKKLKEELIDGITQRDVEDTILDLQSIYDCLGLTCQQIGTYQVDKIAQCGEIPDSLPLAEYVPTTQVHPHAKIDLDILQLRILTSLQSYSFAKLLYRMGRNSVRRQDTPEDPYTVRSLHQMAISNNRKAADPFYTYFVEYHNDPNYADSVVMQTLNAQGKWGATATPEQRTAIVVDTSAYQIMYMQVLAEVADAINSCNQGKTMSSDGFHQWDEVAAFLVGSLEGTSEGGSSDLEDGQLLWNLANKRAFQFQTGNGFGYSLINTDLEDLVFAGRAEIDSLDCKNLERSADRIRHLILLPVIQSSLRYAILNEGQTSSSLSESIAQGESFALAVIPIVAQYDKNAANLIEENMVVRSGAQLVPNGPQGVADAFYQALDEFGYSCALVGAAPQADACLLEGGFANVKQGFDKSRSTSALVTIGFWAAATWLLLCTTDFLW